MKQVGYFGAQGVPNLTYGSYLQVGHLMGLQKQLSDPPQHDEMLFIVIHQVYELWFKQLLHELDAVVARMRAGQALGAQRLLHRCIEIQRVLIGQIKVLETMTPNDFLTFRDRLMPASGFQSAQFRALEFVSGMKNHRHLETFDEGSDERELVQARYDAPSLGEVFYDLLRERGFDLPAGDDARGARVEELAGLYRDPEDAYDLYLLAEALIEYDESWVLWRQVHVSMVERMIGGKRGTGGSEGVRYLQGTLDMKAFPELWEVRSALGDG
jgi:tryptophan 2,3-dioxygenase